MHDVSPEAQAVLAEALAGWTWHVGRQGRGVGYLATLSSPDYRPAIFQVSPQIGFHYRAEGETADMALRMAVGFAGYAVPDAG